MNKRTLGVNYTRFQCSVTSKGDLFDMLCNLAYVKNEPIDCTESVFYTQSVMFSPRFIPQSVFYTQSVVRSPCYILTGLELAYVGGYHGDRTRTFCMRLGEQNRSKFGRRFFIYRNKSSEIIMKFEQQSGLQHFLVSSIFFYL